MANHKSSKKRIRTNGRRTDVNIARRGRIRTYLKKVEMALAAGDKPAAEAALKDCQPELMRGVSRGVMHANTAARKMSRLAHRVKTLGA
jgi:small subunit ribosomal protein S20